jgi:hypothetical protein
MLEPIESHLRAGEVLDAELIAVSAEATVGGRTLDHLLAGPRLRTRRRYARVVALRLLDAGFGLLPSFVAPHYSTPGVL